MPGAGQGGARRSQPVSRRNSELLGPLSQAMLFPPWSTLLSTLPPLCAPKGRSVLGAPAMGHPLVGIPKASPPAALSAGPVLAYKIQRLKDPTHSLLLVRHR